MTLALRDGILALTTSNCKIVVRKVSVGMDFDSIASKVIALIAEAQKLSPDQISLDSFFEELGIDSLGAITLVADLEDEFDIAIPNEEVLEIRTIRQVVESLNKVLSEEPSIKVVS